MTKKTTFPSKKRLELVENAVANGDVARTEALLEMFHTEDQNALKAQLASAEEERNRLAGDRYAVRVILSKNGKPLAEQTSEDVDLGKIASLAQRLLAAVTGPALRADTAARDEARGRAARIEHRQRQRWDQLERERGLTVPRATEAERAIRGRAQAADLTNEVKQARVAARV